MDPSAASPAHTPAFDVLIVGGGVVGSSIAYFLSASQSDAAGGGRRKHGTGAGEGNLRIAVVEMDPSYARSSTALSVGGIRQQFSTPENIEMSLFSAEFIRGAPQTLAVGGEVPDLGFREAGYLFLATEAGLPILRGNHALQTSLGAEIEILDPPALSARFPWLEVGDLAAGSLGVRGEGWLDPHSLLQAFKKKARAQGVEYLSDEVVELGMEGDRITAAKLKEAGRIGVGAVVNAAGPRAAAVAGMAGVDDLPVESRKRFVYRVRCREPVNGVPLTVDPSGVYVRPEGADFLCGVSPPEAADPPTADLVMEYDLFHQVVWPALAHRVPAFEALKLGHSWAGHYAVNTFDQNAILGLHPHVSNLYLANGFSGHGLQQSPAVGRALSELILYGEYQTLELSRFGFGRIASGEPVPEENVV